ncbi:hypothetical protein VULLAG_LOCUS16237 [Vulpes lagopus]
MVLDQLFIKGQKKK